LHAHSRLNAAARSHPHPHSHAQGAWDPFSPAAPPAPHADNWDPFGALPQAAAAPTRRAPPPPPPAYDADDDVFGLGAPAAAAAHAPHHVPSRAAPPPPPPAQVGAPHRAAPPPPPPPGYEEAAAAPPAPSRRAPPPPAGAVAAAGPPQALRRGAEDPNTLSLDLRLPPMHPKAAAPLALLASGWGSLFAGPARGDALATLLQWASAGAAPALPEGGRPAEGEDWDAAPCGQVSCYEDVSAPVTAMAVDEAGGAMYTGHADGRAVRWHVPGPGAPARPVAVWTAHTLEKVTALVVTPCGEVWTGAANGALRVWSFANLPPGVKQPTRVREARNHRGGKPHSKVQRMALAAGGGLVWTAGKATLCIWDAYDGAFLGVIRDPADGWEPADEDDAFFRVDPRQARGRGAAQQRRLWSAGAAPLRCSTALARTRSDPGCRRRLGPPSIDLTLSPKPSF